jgi:hypothetical protein
LSEKIKTSPSVLNTHEKTNRIWHITALNQNNESVYKPQNLPNNDLVDAIKQVMYEGKATKITVILK